VVRSDDFADFYALAFLKVSGAVQAFCDDRDVALEATQEAFARALARWRRVKELDSPQAWVTTTAFNISRRSFRKRIDVPVETESMPEPTSDRIDILVAFRGLPERQRQAAALYYLLDCSVRTVADVMDLSEGTVKAHLSKARSALRISLEVPSA
jgi:RNA polymerase sigma-70 factor (ECF subfamily)